MLSDLIGALIEQISVLPASATAAGYRPNGSIELRVSGEPGSQAALLGVDINAITAKLSDADGLGSGLEMQKVLFISFYRIDWTRTIKVIR